MTEQIMLLHSLNKETKEFEYVKVFRECFSITYLHPVTGIEVTALFDKEADVISFERAINLFYGNK